MWTQVAKDQLEWAKTTDVANREMLQRVLDVQLPQMEEAFANAQKDRQRYEQTYQPIEDQLIADLNQAGSVENQEAEAARRISDVRSQYDQQRSNALMELESFGIDPSQTRHQALDLNFRANEAAAAAFAANMGRKQEEQMGRALRSEAINIGRGMPGQVAQSQGIVNQTAGGAVGNATSVGNTGANMFSSATGAGQLGMQGYNQAANIHSSNFNNQMTAYQAKADAAGKPWEMAAGLAGAAMGMRSFNEGGQVPGDPTQPPGVVDTVPIMATPNEYVIPADVVLRKGTEFFDKLLERYKDGGEYEQKKQGAVPLAA